MSIDTYNEIPDSNEEISVVPDGTEEDNEFTPQNYSSYESQSEELVANLEDLEALTREYNSWDREILIDDFIRSVESISILAGAISRINNPEFIRDILFLVMPENMEEAITLVNAALSNPVFTDDMINNLYQYRTRFTSEVCVAFIINERVPMDLKMQFLSRYIRLRLDMLAVNNVDEATIETILHNFINGTFDISHLYSFSKVFSNENFNNQSLVLDLITREDVGDYTKYTIILELCKNPNIDVIDPRISELYISLSPDWRFDNLIRNEAAFRNSLGFEDIENLVRSDEISRRRIGVSIRGCPEATIRELIDTESNYDVLREIVLNEGLDLELRKDVCNKIRSYFNTSDPEWNPGDSDPQLTEFMVMYMPNIFSLESTSRWHYHKDDVDNLSEDSSLRFVDQVPLEIFAGENLNEQQTINARMMVSRYLDYRDIEPTLETCTDAWDAIKSARERVGGMPVFQGRNVILAINDEMWEDDIDRDGNRFGTVAMYYGIERQNPASITTIRQGQLPEGMSYNDYLWEQIRRTSPPLTFEFSGHGSETGMSYHNDVIGFDDTGVNAGYISVGDLADAIEARYEIWGNRISNDIYIFNACYQSNFLRNLAHRLHERNIPIPIMMAPSEQNLVSYSDDVEYGSSFSRFVLELHRESGTTKISDVIHNMDHYRELDPVMYLPDENNVLIQISNLDEGNEDNVQAA